MRIAITGSSGLIGTALRRSLQADGHVAVPMVRRAPRAGEIGWDPAAGRLDPADLVGIDGVVNLAGESLGTKRWTATRKARIVESRTVGTRLLADALASLEPRPRVLVSGSAVGFYGDRGDEQLTESSGPGSGFLAQLCLDWEAATAAAEEAGVRVAKVRTGLVLDGSDGVLPRLARPFKLGVGGRLGSGRQWMSWIALADHVAALRFLLEHDDLAGPVNLVAPVPVTNAVFTKALGRVLHRPTVVPVPAFAPKVVFGSELVDQLLLASQRVVPGVLLDAGFAFQHDDVESALAAALGKEVPHG